MKCPYCKEEIERFSKTCNVCGERVGLIYSVMDFLKSKINKIRNLSEEKRNKVKTFGICMLSLILVFVISFTAGTMYYKKEARIAETLITKHENIAPHEASLSMYEVAKKIETQEKQVLAYMKERHSKKNKEKVFSTYLTNLEYYTAVFSYTNENLRFYNPENQISTANDDLKFGNKTIISDLEITPVMNNESSPFSTCYTVNYEPWGFENFVRYENNKTIVCLPNKHFPSIKITKPNVPSVKLVYNGWFLADEVSIMSAEPNYKYLDVTYSKYLSPVWKAYFDVKSKQNEDLQNCKFANGNGGTVPFYASSKMKDEWVDGFVDILVKYPDFVMNKGIANEINEIIYPMDTKECKKRFAKLDKNSEAYKIIYDWCYNIEHQYDY